MSDQPTRPTLPPPVVAMIAQARALQSQVDALVLGLEALGYGLAASAARQQQHAERAARESGDIGPVFGAPRPSAPDVANDAASLSPLDATAALARLDVSPPSGEPSHG